jgi:hypothetical protein
MPTSNNRVESRNNHNVYPSIIFGIRKEDRGTYLAYNNLNDTEKEQVEKIMDIYTGLTIVTIYVFCASSFIIPKEYLLISALMHISASTIMSRAIYSNTTTIPS